MVLVFECYGPNKKWIKKLGIGEWDNIPLKQIKKNDTS